MKFEEIKDILKSGDREAIIRVSSKIHNSTDIIYLRELSQHAQDFIRLISELPVDSPFRDYRYNSLLAGNLLSEISKGNCFCVTYKTAENTPESLTHQGVIDILTKDIDIEEQTTYYTCKCKVCGANFNVTAIPTTHFERYVWKRVGC